MFSLSTHTVFFLSLTNWLCSRHPRGYRRGKPERRADLLSTQSASANENPVKERPRCASVTETWSESLPPQGLCGKIQFKALGMEGDRAYVSVHPSEAGIVRSFY